MARPSRRSFPADFFSPKPRQWKGKEKDLGPPTLECNQCHLPLSDSSSNSCISRHSLWCPSTPFVSYRLVSALTSLFLVRNRLFMMNEVIPRRSQSIPHHPQRSIRRHSSSAAHTLSSQTYLRDRPQPDRPSCGPEEPVDELRSLLNASTPFDPEHAWHLFMESVRVDANDVPLNVGEQLQFIRRVLDTFELFGDTPPDLPLLYTWGTRLEPVVRNLKSGLKDNSPDLIPLNCFTAQVYAWLGDDTHASLLARETQGAYLDHVGRCTLLGVYRNISVILRYRLDASHALDLLVREWKFLRTFRHTSSVPFPQVASFHKAIRNILVDIPDGVGLLRSRSNVDSSDRFVMGHLLLEAYCAKKLLHQSHALVLEMRRQQLSVKFHLQISVTRLLARHDLFSLADEIFASIDPLTNPQMYYSAGLYLYARRGDVDRAEEFFAKHNDNHWAIAVARSMLMHAYAVSRQPEKVVKLFNKFFPRTPRGTFCGARPRTVHYTTVIHAHADQADSDSIDFWLKQMQDDGHRPDGHIYSIILQRFALRGDVESVAATLNQMRAVKIEPEHIHYTTVIALLARRKDAVAAEAFYLWALHEGITPDRKMITSLMNAHVEAGSWEGVVRTFDYLRQSASFHCVLSTEVYNTLLKAYVLVGTPFRVVLAIFRKLVRVGVRPDAYTYSWIIQSACDAGKMNTAEELFTEMEDKAKSWGPLYDLETYVLTIIMAGHVRQRSLAKAKGCYEEMKRRGIKPDSRTYKHVLRAYANERTEASLAIAESFLSRIMDADMEDPSWAGTESRPSALGNIYSPLMLVYARKERPEEVARLFNGMLEAGGEPSLECLTIILDVHRRTFNVDIVRKLWPQIWTLAVRDSEANGLFNGDDTSVPMLKRHSNLLCMPLSIYIDAMSAAGDHDAVLDAWTSAKAQGFTFDAHNWNHLAVVLVRAGQPERAFEVLERVLIPYSRKAAIIRDPAPESPLVFDVMGPDVDMPVSDAPMHRDVRRARVVKKTTDRVRGLLPSPEDSTDFTHPLHILQQVIPGLSMWRPHAVTLQILSQVLEHLQRGRLVQPIRGPNTPPATLNHTDTQSHAEAASAALHRIYHNYPEAVREVKLYERRLARRAAVLPRLRTRSGAK
ncbi:hypothetical protein JVU11DRAFT_1552 [Chiua virens]|nr:hypothetical protein JVU11DRAFT_1552 [Chiua virens]